MPVVDYLRTIERLTGDDATLDVPVWVPQGWRLPENFCVGRELLWVIRHVIAPPQLWPRQEEIIRAVETESRTSVRSCQASGKSWTASAVVIAFLLSQESAVVITSAPSDRQVRQLLWGNLHEVFRQSRLPLPGDLLQTSLRLGPMRYAMGFASDPTDVEKWHGFHSPGGMLIVLDEASGIAQAVFDGLKGSLTSQNAKLLMLSNPSQVSGTFHESQTSQRHLYRTISISFRDTPNFNPDGSANADLPAPYLITPEFVEAARRDWGEDGANYQIRVLGEFPTQASDALIALNWVEAAVARPAPPDILRKTVEIGADIARYGADRTAVCVRRGDEVIAVEHWAKFDTTYSAERIAELAREHRASVIRVDAVGVGAGAFDHLRQLKDAGALPLGVRLIEFNAAAKARDPERFKMRRDEVWDSLRTRFKEQRICCLPNNQDLIGELTAIRFRYDSANRMMVEPKDEMRRRGLRSPDLAEAVLFSFAEDRPSGEGATFDRLMEEAMGGTILPNLMDRIF
jgi:hypothetical protein